jgi:hypothetical protein
MRSIIMSKNKLSMEERVEAAESYIQGIILP